MRDTHNKSQDEIAPDGSQLTLAHVWRLLNAVSSDVEAIKRKQDEYLTAFVVNDLNRPDLDGHRRAHIKLDKAQQTMDGYKYEMTKKVLGIVVASVVTFAITLLSR